MSLLQVFKYRGREVYKIRNNFIYYGNLDDKFVVVFVVLGIEEYKGYKIVLFILVEFQINNLKFIVKERVVKKVEVDNFYKVFEFVYVWFVQVNGK